MDLPADPVWAVAGSIILSSVLWGIVFFDLIGLTHLTAWRERLSEGSRKVFLVFSVLMGLITLAILAGGLTYWRAVAVHASLAEEGEAPETVAASSALTIGMTETAPAPVSSASLPSEEKADDTTGAPDFWVIYLVLGGITFLSTTGSAVCLNGFVTHLKYLVLAVAFVLSLPLSFGVFLLWLLVTLLDGLYSLTVSVLDAVSHVGQPLLRLVRISGKPEVKGTPNGAEEATGSTKAGEVHDRPESHTREASASQSSNRAAGSHGSSEDVHFDPFRF